jgi:hypothetical protein
MANPITMTHEGESDGFVVCGTLPYGKIFCSRIAMCLGRYAASVTTTLYVLIRGEVEAFPLALTHNGILCRLEPNKRENVVKL